MTSRRIHRDAVAAFNEALAQLGSEEIVHLTDPSQDVPFAAGGPPLWTIGHVAVPDGTLFVTYGLSRAIDADRSGDFELSIRTPGAAQLWPAFLLSGLARYMLERDRELKVGHYMPMRGPITRKYVPNEQHEEMPDTGMSSIYLTWDPDLPGISTTDGAVGIRRVVGMHPGEAQLMEAWSVKGFAQTARLHDPTLSTDIERPPLTEVPPFVRAMEAGSKKHGSAIPYVAIDGVSWSDEHGSVVVHLPGGDSARRLLRMLRARLQFDNALLVHAATSGDKRAVAFEPGDALAYRTEGDVLVLTLPLRHEFVQTLEQPGSGRITWKLS